VPLKELVLEVRDWLYLDILLKRRNGYGRKHATDIGVCVCKANISNKGQPRRDESRNLFVAAADIWHQPMELSDGIVLWRPNFCGGAERGECKIDMLNDDCLVQARDK
jgi:hypothetical protein